MRDIRHNRLPGLTLLTVLAALGAVVSGAAGQEVVPYCDEPHTGFYMEGSMYKCRIRYPGSEGFPTDCEIQANAQVPDGTKAFVKYKNADGTERTIECSVRSMRQ